MWLAHCIHAKLFSCPFLLRGMKDISTQLESNIDKVLQDYPDAHQMAKVNKLIELHVPRL
jgi:hypothetical protein